MGLSALLWLRGVPLLVWPLALACAGFLYERHEAKVYKDRYVLLQAQDSTAKIDALQRKSAEDARRIAAQKEEIDESEKRVQVVSAGASAAAASVGRLSGQLAALKRASSSGGAAAAPVVTAACQTAGVLADLLGQCEHRSAVRSLFADRANAAGLGCERQYDSLTEVRK